MSEVDLHLHTTVSDGRLTPAQLVDLVAQRGLRIVAITDHDITDGLEPAWEAATRYPGLTILPGVELSCDIPGDEVHLLGLGLDYQDGELQKVLKEFRRGRTSRGELMVERLAVLGYPLDWERVREIAGEGSIGRPHIAQAMVEKGYVGLPQEAFERFLGRNAPAYVERAKLTPREAVELVVRAKGVPVLAHPGQIVNLMPVLDDLTTAGLVGMEVHYGNYPPQKVQGLARLAQDHGLLPCGGSDYHALGTPGEVLPGDVGPPLEVAQRLMSLVEQRWVPLASSQES